MNNQKGVAVTATEAEKRTHAEHEGTYQHFATWLFDNAPIIDCAWCKFAKKCAGEYTTCHETLLAEYEKTLKNNEEIKEEDVIGRLHGF